MVFWRSKKDDSPKSPTHPAAEPVSATPPPDEAVADAKALDAAFNEVQDAPSDNAAESPTETSSGGGIFGRMKAALSKTRTTLNTDIRDLFKKEGRLVDDQFLTDLFGRLIRTDMGVTSAEKIRDEIGKKHRARMVHFEEIIDAIAEETATLLTQGKAELAVADSGPTVILVVGVNGSGKTTSIAKLANHLQSSGRQVVLGAGDTFRAAAVEQLTVWAGRIGCDIVTGKHEADPASVAFKTVERALQTDADVAIIDTAGRLQTQTHLMSQLEKIRRVIGKNIDDAPHEVLLVLDATAGQNAINQAKGFSEAAGCTGIVLAKLDGSARGGVILPIRDQFDLPVKFVGVGEGISDLERFDAAAFAKGLFSSD